MCLSVFLNKSCMEGWAMVGSDGRSSLSDAFLDFLGVVFLSVAPNTFCMDGCVLVNLQSKNLLKSGNIHSSLSSKACINLCWKPSLNSK